MRSLPRRIAGLLAVALFGVAACGDLPRDPAGTLERASGGVLRAGAADSPPHLVVQPGGRPAGPEAELVEAFARSIGARVEWRIGPADELMRALEERELDVVAAGLTRRSPWATHVGFTRPWIREGDDERVLAVAAGENATLVALDRLIESRRGERL